MDWRCGSSSRVLSLQVQSPEFKPQSCRKKKKLKNTEEMSLYPEGARGKSTREEINQH
jgi:hypothetical protein